MSNPASSVADIARNTKTLVNSGINTTTTKTLVEVRSIAQKLSDKLNNPSRFEYYCKVAWKLPEHRIWINLEIALTGNSPARYFSFLCSKEMN